MCHGAACLAGDLRYRPSPEPGPPRRRPGRGCGQGPAPGGRRAGGGCRCGRGGGLSAVVVREAAVGGRHAAPAPGTGVVMAGVLAALLAWLAAVVIPAAVGGCGARCPVAGPGAVFRPLPPLASAASRDGHRGRRSWSPAKAWGHADSAVHTARSRPARAGPVGWPGARAGMWSCRATGLVAHRRGRCCWQYGHPRRPSPSCRHPAPSGRGCRLRRPLLGRHAARGSRASHTRRWAAGSGHPKRPAR